MGCEPAGDLLGYIVVAGHVVDHDYPPVGARYKRVNSQVGLNLVTSGSGDGNRLSF